MTSISEVPGAKAVILNREEITDDDNHMRSRYMRIKILTDAGKDLGDVRAVYDRRSDGHGYVVSEVAGRTIQPDGTVVPLTGKPFDKVLGKDKENQYTVKVFTMPAVQVGSIIEYRYKVRWEDNLYFSPDWDIQETDEDLFLRKGHFLWKPTDKQLSHTSRGGRESYTSMLVWDPVLPPNTDVKRTQLPNGRQLMEVNVANVLPYGREEYMPPINSSYYHVHFYYSPYRTGQEFWSTEGKYWSADTNKFIGNSNFVHDAAAKAVAGAASDEDKLRRLYAFTSELENTDYTRQRTAAEEKSQGLKQTQSAEDVLRRKRGTSDEIALTFVALARAAGMNASAMVVTDRDHRLFNVNWMDMRQLEDDIAIVNYGGADHFFDPGSPYCPFGHLAWPHSDSAGVRQQGKDTVLAPTSGESYKYSRTARVADLKLEDGGHMEGTVTITFQGSPAVRWRQAALKNDEAELHEQMKKSLEEMMPGGSEVEVKSIENLKAAEQPLKVTYSVKGNLGNAAGSRVVLPADIFVAGDRPVFPHEKRERPVYFPYAQMVQDAMRIAYPSGFSVESAPTDDSVKYKTQAAYTQRSKQTGNSVTIWRDFLIGEFYYPLDSYPQLREFYSNFERKDHSSIVLKRTSQEKASVEKP